MYVSSCVGCSVCDSFLRIHILGLVVLRVCVRHVVGTGSCGLCVIYCLVCGVSLVCLFCVWSLMIVCFVRVGVCVFVLCVSVSSGG